MKKLELKKFVLLELLPMIIPTYDDKAIDTIQYPFMTQIFKCLRKKMRVVISATTQPCTEAISKSIRRIRVDQK